MKFVVNILDNELCSSKARINFNRNKIDHVVKLMCFFLTLFNGHVVLSDWSSGFWIVTQEPDFGLCGKLDDH